MSELKFNRLISEYHTLRERLTETSFYSDMGDDIDKYRAEMLENGQDDRCLQHLVDSLEDQVKAFRTIARGYSKIKYRHGEI